MRLVGSFTSGEERRWQIYFQDFAGSTDLLASSTNAIILQNALPGEGWQTRSVVPAAGGSIGVRSLARSGRVIFPAGSSMEAVELDAIGFSCESATHSRLGSLVEASDGMATPEFIEGDSLELVYTSSSGGDGEDCFFRVLIPAPSQQARLQPRAIDSALPAVFALYPARPNPFTQETTIRFDLPKPAQVRIDVFDVQGRRIATLASSYREAGRHAVSWSGRSESGLRAAAGIYLCRMKAGEFTAEKRISLLP